MNNNLKLLNSVQTWLNPIFDQHTQNEVIKLLNAPINDLEESFYSKTR